MCEKLRHQWIGFRHLHECAETASPQLWTSTPSAVSLDSSMQQDEEHWQCAIHWPAFGVDQLDPKTEMRPVPYQAIGTLFASRQSALVPKITS